MLAVSSALPQSLDETVSQGADENHEKKQEKRISRKFAADPSAYSKTLSHFSKILQPPVTMDFF